MKHWNQLADIGYAAQQMVPVYGYLDYVYYCMYTLYGRIALMKLNMKVQLQ